MDLEYITFTKYFTNWVEAKSCKLRNTCTTAKFLYENVIVWYNYAFQLSMVSDLA